MLEALANGNYKVPIKGKNSVEVPFWVTVVILTNTKSFSDVYDKENFDLGALEKRFNVLDMQAKGIAPYQFGPVHNVWDAHCS